MKEFTRQNLKKLREEIDGALEKVAKKNNIMLSIGSISFNDDEFHTKLTALVNRVEGQSVKEAKYKADLEKNGFLFGISGKDYGKTFFSNGETFKLVGLAPSRPKYPVIGESVRTGKKFKFTESVLSQLKK